MIQNKTKCKGCGEYYEYLITIKEGTDGYCYRCLEEINAMNEEK